MDTAEINDYFHVDDLIALPIQILNRKGYLTIGCCAGVHPQPATIPINPNDWVVSSCWIIFKDDISLPCIPLGFVKEFYNDNLKERAKIAKQEKKQLRDKSLLIKHVLQYRNKLMSGCDESDNTIYGIWREQLDAIERLYKWALDLSDFKS